MTSSSRNGRNTDVAIVHHLPTKRGANPIGVARNVRRKNFAGGTSPILQRENFAVEKTVQSHR
jgi:hypothetical protein